MRNCGKLESFIENRSFRCSLPTPGEEYKSHSAISSLPCGRDIGGSENQAEWLFYFPQVRRSKSQIVRLAFNSMKDQTPTTETPDMRTELSHSIPCGCSMNDEGAAPCRFPTLLRLKHWRVQDAKGLVSDVLQYGYFIIVPKNGTPLPERVGVVTLPSRCLSFPEGTN
jgi:hypothetical protein